MSEGIATIRVKPIDGPWETLGAGRLRGIVPEDIEASSDSWGPSTMTFTLNAEPGAMRPDLLPFTPIELEIDGMLVWAGRVHERPAGEREHNVNCRGWQYHLDDDLFNRIYVHTRLGDYRDQRTFLTAQLPNFQVSGVVSNDDGSIVIGWPNGAVVAVNGAVGVTLDLGPDSTAKRVVMDWESTNNSGGTSCLARVTDVEDALAATWDQAFGFAMNSGASGTSAGTLATARRYLHVFLSLAAGATLAADLHLRIKAIKVFRDTAYESGNASILKADTVVKDARAVATLLNQSNDYITAGTFSIPEAFTNGYQTPRDAMEMVNAYENYQIKVGGPDLKTLVYGTKPSVPLFEVGDWSGSEFSDGSVSGEEIFDTAVVDSTGPDGATLIRKRTQTGTLVDRNGFHRARTLPIRSAITSAVGDRFGDLWLTEHKTAPFAGRLVVKGNGARRVQGGSTVPPYEFLIHAGEKMRLAHRLDPDTGAWGRDGRIAGVTYRHNERSVTIDIDDRRGHFEQILSRYGVLVDQLR